MNKPELSKCPFCGRPAHYEQSYKLKEGDTEIFGGCWVECNGCNCQVGRLGWDSQENDEGAFDTYQDAARAWNRRSNY